MKRRESQRYKKRRKGSIREIRKVKVKGRGSKEREEEGKEKKEKEKKVVI